MNAWICASLTPTVILRVLRNTRWYHPIVDLAAPAIENAGKGVQKGANLEIWMRQSPEPERTERKNVKEQGHAASLIISLATHGRGCPSRGKGTALSNSSHSRGLGGFAWAIFIEVPLACDGVTLARPFLSLCVSGTVVRRRACLASRVSMALETHT